MSRNAPGVFCIALAALLLELNLIRIFDVLWYPNMVYMVITLAVFSFGLAGVYLSLKPVQFTEKTWLTLSYITIVMAFWVVLIFDSLLESRTLVRMLSSVIIIFPLAFFLGMPFPMGVMAIQHKPNGTIAWAWGLNGLFTVIGGVFCSIFSVYFGFVNTVLVAMMAYVVAFIMYKSLYKSYQSERS